MTTGQLIRAARKKAGITQTELAQKLNIPFQSVSQWERDLRNPKYETIKRIAAALNIEWIELVPEDMQGQTVIDHIKRELTTPQDLSKTEKNKEDEFKALAQIAKAWSQTAETLKRIKHDSPEKFKRIGIPLAEVDSDIAIAEDWAESIASILILSGFSEEGAKKVVSYAEDILPRYQAPQSTPPDTEDNDTTPPPDAPETK